MDSGRCPPNKGFGYFGDIGEMTLEDAESTIKNLCVIEFSGDGIRLREETVKFSFIRRESGLRVFGKLIAEIAKVRLTV